jgi:hypothetical protein
MNDFQIVSQKLEKWDIGILATRSIAFLQQAIFPLFQRVNKHPCQD